MPVEFLTDERAEAYGTFTEVPTRPEPERFLFLDDDDRDLIALRRTDAHRPGMAVRICTVRYVGRFPGEDPLAVPWEVVEYLAGQLGILDASCVKRYAERRSTVYEHADEIQRRFTYRDFTDRKWGREFRSFPYGRAWTHAEGPVRVDASARMGASAFRTKHPITAPVVTFSAYGARAVSETNAVVIGENVDLRLGCNVHNRFVDRLEKRDGVWRISDRKSVYDFGTFTFTFPAGIVDIDAEKVGRCPREYAALAYLLEASGFPVDRVFATKDSDLERDIKESAFTWLGERAAR